MANQQNSIAPGQDNGTALITSLLKLAQGVIQNGPLASASRAAGSWAGQQAGQNPAAGMTMAAAQAGPYQKGVSKALQAAGEAHAAEAIQSGMNPNDIQNHSMMAPQQPQQLGTGTQGGFGGPMTTSAPIDQNVLQAQQANQQMAQPQAAQGQQAHPLNILAAILQGAGAAGMQNSGIGQFNVQNAQAQQLRQQTRNMSPMQPGESIGSRLTPEQMANAVGANYKTKLEGADKMVEDLKAQHEALEKQADEASKQATATMSTKGFIGRTLGDKGTSNTLSSQIHNINLQRIALADKRAQAELYRASLLDAAPNFQERGSKGESKGNSFSGKTSTGLGYTVS